MKDFLEHIGLTEIFAYLCPGAVVLCSLGLWFDETPSALLAFAEKQPILAGFLALVASYMIGLVVAIWGAVGSSKFVSVKKARAASPSLSIYPPVSWFRRGYPLLWFFHALPVPREDQAASERLMKLGEQMESYGLRNVPLPPWEFLTAYRTIASGAIPEKGQPVLMAANNMHNRLLFSIGVALSLLLAALQATLLLVPDYARAAMIVIQEGRAVSFAFPDVRMAVLLAAGAASFALRWVAGHLWERELYLTTSLTNFEMQDRRRPGLFD